MTSKEIIRRLVDHDSPPRFGFDFSDRRYNDFGWAPGAKHFPKPKDPYASWGHHKELLELTGFSGEVCRDGYGNILGRFDGKTKGECIRGVLQSWDDFELFQMPKLDHSLRDELLSKNLAASDKYITAGACSLFSTLRDCRLMPNALADTVLEPEMVHAFLDKIASYWEEQISIIAGCGIDAIFTGDDWGTQDRTFISPESFAEIFKPYYKRLGDAVHNAGMKLFMHSCGDDYEIIPHFIEAGIDVFQFDQPDLYPSEVLANEFADKVCFYSPVDIQKILPTGDRELIEKRALEMTEIFRKVGGGMIFKDYPSYHDIGVDEEWATWAREVIVKNAEI